MIDPGPDVEDHVRALALAVEGATSVVVLVTHHHADHAAAAGALADRLGGVEVLGPHDVPGVTRTLEDGDRVPVDAGSLIAVHTPGHSKEHLCFHWPDHSAVFVGDLLLGEGNTTWVAEYTGCVADYLDSLERVRGLAAKVLFPAHGPPLEDPEEAITRFRAHRLDRIEQVRSVLNARPEADIDHLLDSVYGPSLPDQMRGAAARSIGALADYVRGVHG